jgi:hypothetical protein
LSDPHESAHAQDKCPKWAEELVVRLRGLEIQLGNLKPDDGWQSLTAQSLAERAARLNAQEGNAELDASLTETLFQRLCRGLSEEGFGPEAIAAMVNCRLHSERLPYCSTDDVDEVLNDNQLD